MSIHQTTVLQNTSKKMIIIIRDFYILLSVTSRTSRENGQGYRQLNNTINQPDGIKIYKIPPNNSKTHSFQMHVERKIIHIQSHKTKLNNFLKN